MIVFFWKVLKLAFAGGEFENEKSLLGISRQVTINYSAKNINNSGNECQSSRRIVVVRPYLYLRHNDIIAMSVI